ncbi:MAG TPA: toll/interleukin-1 receptor domain-containing protein [Ktedonobacterales bacterium]|nr:toll/interleukin-1 receptor domain-containing protein [Ktedonobacterales bacterium]
MARVIVLYDSHDKAYAESFSRAAQLREPSFTFDARDNVGAFALDTEALARYDALIALLSPDALNSPALLRVLAHYTGGPLIAAIIRPVVFPDSLNAAHIIQGEHLTAAQLAAEVLSALTQPAPQAEEEEEEQEEIEEESTGGTAVSEWDMEEERSRGWLPPGDVADVPPPPAPAPVPEPPMAQPPKPAPPPPAPGAPPPPDVVGAQTSVPPSVAGGTPASAETLQFSAYHPNEAPVEAWQTLLVYAHLAEHLSQVQADAGTFTELGSSPTMAQGQSLRKIAPNVEITIEPHVEGVTFSPAQDSFIWRGEWHRSLFRYSGAKMLAGTVQKGWIDIYADRISPICTIEVSFSFHSGIPAASVSVPGGMAVTSNAFDTVFISYSHRDREAMQQAVETYQKMSITIYNDDRLAAGDNYERELARMIQAANVFHLLWSDASARSAEVRKEWQLALTSQKSERFIRPWYWQRPLIAPPQEFQERRISFRYEHLRRKLLHPSTWF